MNVYVKRKHTFGARDDIKLPNPYIKLPGKNKYGGKAGVEVVHILNLASHRLREFLRLSNGLRPSAQGGAGAGLRRADRTQANERSRATL